MKEIQTFAVTYIPEITEVLNRVPRQMILLLKTNDLLRGIDSKLSTPKSFVTLSRCCVRAVKDYDLSNCNSFTCWVRTHVQANFDEVRISLYQLSLTSFARNFAKVWTIFSSPFNYIFNFIIKKCSSIF